MEKDFNFYFRQDLFFLLNTFYKDKSFRFSDFVNTWNELKFFQIFTIQRFFPIEYRFLVKDTLKITAEFLYDEELYPEVRTAALYTLYALYVNQMNRPRLKIPLTPQQWIQILKFIDHISQAEHVDVEYAFRYLVHSDAFEFCSTYEINHEFVGLKALGQSKSSKTTTDDAKSQVADSDQFKNLVFNDEINEQIGTIHEAYLQCKDDLKSGSFDKLASYINPDFKSVIGQVGPSKNPSEYLINFDWYLREDILDKLGKPEKKESVFDRSSSKREPDDDFEASENEEEMKPTTSKEAAKNSAKKTRKNAKSKFNRNFQGMFLDADESDNDD